MTRALRPIAIGAAVLALYVLRLDSAAGLFVDDAWYIILAKALSEGQGFQLISSATGAFVPPVPPVFPMMLAPVWLANPTFPDNVAALKSISIVAALGIGFITYRYLTRYRSTPPNAAAAIAIITMTMPSLVFLATSTVMSEVMFTLGQLAAALAIERATREDRSMTGVVAAGLFSGMTMLIRSAGIAGVGAGVAYLAMKRGWRATIVFIVVVGMCYAPWALYVRAHRATEEARAAHGGSISFSYEELLLMRHGGEPNYGRATLADLPGRIVVNIGNVFGRDLGAMILPSAYRGPDESGMEVFGMSGETGLRASSMGGANATFVLSALLSAIALIGFAGAARSGVSFAEWLVMATVGMILLVPARTFRYVLPMAPFVIWYFLSGVERIAAWFRKQPWQFGASSRIATVSILAMFAIEHGQYLAAARRGPLPAWLQEYRAATDITDWMTSHLTGGGDVASNNAGLVYLATGRKGVSMGSPAEHWSSWRRSGVRFAVAVRPVEKPQTDLGYSVLYEPSNTGLWILGIDVH